MSLIYNYAPRDEKASSMQGPWVSVQSRGKKSAASEEGAMQVAPMEFTLYYQGTTRSRFAFAVFLLGKDVQQLLTAHGIKPNGSKYLLQNLYNLVAAAYSGLVHYSRI